LCGYHSKVSKFSDGILKPFFAAQNDFGSFWENKDILKPFKSYFKAISFLDKMIDGLLLASQAKSRF